MSFYLRAGAVALVATAAASPASAGAQTPAPPGASDCPVAPDPAALPSADRLKQMNSFVAKLGARPTGSKSHVRYINGIRKQLKTVPGIQTRDIAYPINRWSASKTTLKLTVGGKTRRLLVAGPVPYSKPTKRKGVKAPLAFVPAGTKIETATAGGEVVARGAPAGSIQQALFLLVSWNMYDPNHTINPADNFKGDFIAYLERIA